MKSCLLLAGWSLASSIICIIRIAIIPRDPLMGWLVMTLSKSRSNAWETYNRWDTTNSINIIILEDTEWMRVQRRLDRVYQPGWWGGEIWPQGFLTSCSSPSLAAWVLALHSLLLWSCLKAQLRFQILVLNLTNFNRHLAFVRQRTTGQ